MTITQSGVEQQVPISEARYRQGLLDAVNQSPTPTNPPTETVSENKFHKGAKDGKHYWLTPPDVYEKLDKEFNFDFDPCPYPKPDDFDGLTGEWGKSNYVNPPFGAIIHQGKKKGQTAWTRKAIEEYKKGKKVVMVFPIDKWILMLIKEGVEIRNLGDIRWLATEDRKPGKGTGRHIACFILDPQANPPLSPTVEKWRLEFVKIRERNYKEKWGDQVALVEEIQFIEKLISHSVQEAKAEMIEKIWTWAVDNGITDKKSFVALRDYLASLKQEEEA